jgi:hypothetical protein
MPMTVPDTDPGTVIVTLPEEPPGTYYHYGTGGYRPVRLRYA